MRLFHARPAFGVALLLLAAATTASAASSVPDAIREGLDAAKAQYSGEMVKLKEQLLADLDRKLVVVRRAGDKAQVDRVKGDIEALTKSGKLPTTVSTGPYEKGATRAREKVLAAFQLAVKEYTKAAKDDEATSVAKEQETFLSGTATTRPSEPPAAKPLFNGKDLTGWHATDTSSWQVVDGVLKSQGTGSGWLVTDRSDFADVHVRCEVKIAEGSNSGLAIRMDPVTSRKLEASINVSHRDTNRTGSFYNGSGCVVKVPKAAAGADTWFTFEVIAMGNKTIALVNGVQVSEYIDIEKKFVKGAIAVQEMGGGGVAFRKIEVESVKP
jgi:hypothetical protein